MPNRLQTALVNRLGGRIRRFEAEEKQRLGSRQKCCKVLTAGWILAMVSLPIVASALHNHKPMQGVDPNRTFALTLGPFNGFAVCCWIVDCARAVYFTPASQG